MDCLDDLIRSVLGATRRSRPHLFSAYMFFFYAVYLFRVAPRIDDFGTRWTCVLVATFLLAMYQLSVTVATHTPCAFPDRQYYLSSKEVIDVEKSEDCEEVESILRHHIKLRNVKVEEFNADGTIRFCETCMCIRPDRAHHCTECGTCMLRRDHHCALMNSCVHQDNMKAYFLLLLYGSIYSTWMFVTDFKYTYFDIPEERGHFWFAASFSYFMCIQMSLWLWVTYVYLIPRNLLLRDKWSKRNPHGDLGWKKNLQRVFGPNPLLWLIPTRGAYKCKNE